MVTWVGVGFQRGVIPRSWWGHLKVIARSNDPKMVETILLDQHLINRSKPNPNTHDDIGWALFHRGVTPRSWWDNCSKSSKNKLLSPVFLLVIWPGCDLEVTLSSDNLECLEFLFLASIYLYANSFLVGTLLRNNLGIFTCLFQEAVIQFLFKLGSTPLDFGRRVCHISPAGWFYLKFWFYRWYHGHNRIIYSKDICCYTTFKKRVVYFSWIPQPGPFQGISEGRVPGNYLFWYNKVNSGGCCWGYIFSFVVIGSVTAKKDIKYHVDNTYYNVMYAWRDA